MIERIKAIIERGEDYSVNNPRELVKVYKEVYKEEVCSYCPGKIREKFRELSNITEDKLISMTERKYRMIPGKVLDTSMGNTVPGQYTDKNMTDEIAVKLIASGYGKFFVGNPTPEDIEQANPVATPAEESESSIIRENKSLDSYSYTRLVEYCKRNEFPEEEWKRLDSRKKLLPYVKSK